MFILNLQRLKLKLLLASAICCMGDAAIAQGFAGVEAAATYQGTDRQQRLVEGAKREGVFNLYTSLNTPIAANVKADFERRYPEIKVNLWRASSESVLQRSVSEARANRFAVDFIETNGPEMEAVQREKRLQRVTSPHFQNIIAQAIFPHHEWVAIRLNLFVQCFNSNKVSRDELPKSFQDLLQPRWKGRLTVEAGDFDWFMSVTERLGEKEGIKLFRDIVATNGISMRKGHALMAEMVNAGEIPHAAFLLYDYLLSDAQPLLAQNELAPVSTLAASPLQGRQVQFVEPKRVLADQQKWETLFNDIVLAKGK